MKLIQGKYFFEGQEVLGNMCVLDWLFNVRIFFLQLVFWSFSGESLFFVYSFSFMLVEQVELYYFKVLNRYLVVW